MSGVLPEPLTKYWECRIGGPSYDQRTLDTTIGREPRSYRGLCEPIPDRMLEMLRQLDDGDVTPGRSRT
jgi:hypothetical protein